MARRLTPNEVAYNAAADAANLAKEKAVVAIGEYNKAAAAAEALFALDSFPQLVIAHAGVVKDLVRNERRGKVSR